MITIIFLTVLITQAMCYTIGFGSDSGSIDKNTPYIRIFCHINIDSSTGELPPYAIRLSNRYVSLEANDVSSSSVTTCENSLVFTAKELATLPETAPDQFGYTDRIRDVSRYSYNCHVNYGDLIGRSISTYTTHPGKIDYETVWKCGYKPTSTDDWVETSVGGDSGMLPLDFKDGDFELLSNSLPDNNMDIIPLEALALDCGTVLDKFTAKDGLVQLGLPLLNIDFAFKDGNTDTIQYLNGDIYGRDNIAPRYNFQTGRDYFIVNKNDLPGCGNKRFLDRSVDMITPVNNHLMDLAVKASDLSFYSLTPNLRKVHGTEKDAYLINTYEDEVRTRCFNLYTKTDQTVINPFLDEAHCSRYDLIVNKKTSEMLPGVSTSANKLVLDGDLFSPFTDLDKEEIVEFTSPTLIMEQPKSEDVVPVYVGANNNGHRAQQKIIPSKNLYKKLYRAVSKSLATYSKMKIGKIKITTVFNSPTLTCGDSTAGIYRYIFISDQSCSIGAPTLCGSGYELHIYDSVNDYLYLQHRTDIPNPYMGVFNTYFCFSQPRTPINNLKEFLFITQPDDTRDNGLIGPYPSDTGFSDSCYDAGAAGGSDIELDTSDYTSEMIGDISFFMRDVGYDINSAGDLKLSEFLDKSVVCQCGQTVNPCFETDYQGNNNTLGGIKLNNDFVKMLVAQPTTGEMWCESMGYRSPKVSAKLLAAKYVCNSYTNKQHFNSLMGMDKDLFPKPDVEIEKNLVLPPEKRYVLQCKDVPTACLKFDSMSFTMVSTWEYDPPVTIESIMGSDVTIGPLGTLITKRVRAWGFGKDPLTQAMSPIYNNYLVKAQDNELLFQEELIDSDKLVITGYDTDADYTVIEGYLKEDEIKPNKIECGYGILGVNVKTVIEDFQQWIVDDDGGEPAIVCGESNYVLSLSKTGDNVANAELTWTGTCPTPTELVFNVLSNNEVNHLYGMKCLPDGSAVISGIHKVKADDVTPLLDEELAEEKGSYCIVDGNKITAVMITNYNSVFIPGLKFEAKYKVENPALDITKKEQFSSITEACMDSPKSYPLKLTAEEPELPQTFVFSCEIPEFLLPSGGPSGTQCPDYKDMPKTAFWVVYSGVFLTTTRYSIASSDNDDSCLDKDGVKLTDVACEVVTDDRNNLTIGIKVTAKDTFFVNLLEKVPGFRIKGYCGLGDLTYKTNTLLDLTDSMNRIMIQIPQDESTTKSTKTEEPNVYEENEEGVDMFYYYISIGVLVGVLVFILTMIVLLCMQRSENKKMKRLQDRNRMVTNYMYVNIFEV